MKEHHSNPEVTFAVIEEKQYKPELDQLDRNLLFSAELLRLSLLGIAVFGFIVKEVYVKLLENNKNGIPITGWTYSHWFFLIGVFAFSLSAAFALLHRLAATNSMRFYLNALKYKNSNKETQTENELKRRHRSINRSRTCKWLSAGLLALGVLLISSGFFTLI